MPRLTIGCVIVTLLFTRDALAHRRQRSADELMRNYGASIQAYHNGDSSMVIDA